MAKVVSSVAGHGQICSCDKVEDVVNARKSLQACTYDMDMAGYGYGYGYGALNDSMQLHWC